MDTPYTVRAEIRDCIGETIPLWRRWVAAIMAGPVGRLLARISSLEAELDEERQESARLALRVTMLEAERDKAERDALRAACVAAQKSIGRFPGSVHDRAMAKINKALGRFPSDFTDPDEARALAAEAERDATAKRDAHEFALRSEAPGDPWEMVRHLEEQCRLFIHERNEWKAVADRNRVARRAAETERDAAIRERLPHMCRDDHPEIRHAVSDDDERCPVCRERDRALAAETDMKAAESHADALNEKLVALAPHGTCACSHDRPGDVCSHHSPALRAAEAENTRLKETVEAAATRFEDIAAGRAFQPRLHAATGATEARAVLATIPSKENPDA